MRCRRSCRARTACPKWTTQSSRRSSAHSATTSPPTRTPRTSTPPTRPPCRPPSRASIPGPRRPPTSRPPPAKYAHYPAFGVASYCYHVPARPLEHLLVCRRQSRSTSSACRRFLPRLQHASDPYSFDLLTQFLINHYLICLLNCI